MKNLLAHRLLPLLCLALVPLLPAADTFEGKVSMRYTEGAKSKKSGGMVVTWRLKGDRVRMDMPKEQMEGAEGYMLLDEERSSLVFFMLPAPEERMGPMANGVVMRYPLRAAANAAQAAEAASTLRPTGRTETIAGYAATEYIIEEKSGVRTELWLTDRLGKFMMATGGGMGSAPTAPGWEAAVRAGHFFPLRVVELDKKGKEKSRMEVVSVESVAIPDEDFTVPANAMDASAMMGGMFGR